MTGMVFNIQRFSLHDGPGIRTTVFLKGCPLRCLWCHNPEGWTAAPQVRLAHTLCTLCGRCAAACTHGGHTVNTDGHKLALAACVRCGACIDACLAGALEMTGQEMSVDDVIAIVERDLPFYRTSGGGITLSGGEPLAQYAFTAELLQRARAQALHTAMETTLYADWTRIEALAPCVDLWLVDLKHIDPARHRELTGVDNTGILDNITRLSQVGWDARLRVPFVPGVNTEPDFLDALEAFVTALPRPIPVEFMLYHRLGASKWSGLGEENPLPDSIPAATREDVAPWVERLRQAGIPMITSD